MQSQLHPKPAPSKLEELEMDLAQEQPTAAEISPLPVPQQPTNIDADIIPIPILQVGLQREFMCSALYNAAASGNVERVVNLLGNTSEGVSFRDVHGSCRLSEVTAERNTVLHIAAGFGYRDLAEVVCGRDTSLLASENSSIPTRSETPLLCAAREGRHDMVFLLIRLAQECGMDEALTKKNVAGDTALHEAAKRGHGEVAMVLMRAAPALALDVNQAGMSPLYLAVMSRSVVVVQALIRYENASFAGPKGQTALHAAVLQSRGITSLLLNWKPSLAYMCDASNSTPLHYAASDSDTKIVKMLLESAPSTVYVQDEHGRSPIHVAASMGHVDVLDLIIQTCPDSVEILDKEGKNFLHAGVEKGWRSVARYVCQRPRLLKHINEQDNRGDTPLHLAVINQHSSIVFQILEAKGVRTSIMNNEGNTPLEITNRSVNSLCPKKMSTFQVTRILVALTVTGSQYSSQRQDHLKLWKAKGLSKKASSNLIIVAVLIATIAFSATFNVPGGYDDSDGRAMAHNTLRYKVFIVSDAIAMISSVIATIFLVGEMALQEVPGLPSFIMAAIFVWVALVSMEVAFIAGALISLGKDPSSYVIAWVSTFALVFLTAAACKILSFVVTLDTLVQYVLLMYKEDQQHTRRRINRQYKAVFPFKIGIFVFILVNLVVYAIMSTIFQLI